MKTSNESGRWVGIAGLAVSVAALLLFRVVPVALLLGLILGLQAAAYAWLTGWHRLALAGLVAASIPSLIEAVSTRGLEFGVVSGLCLAATMLGAWVSRRDG